MNKRSYSREEFALIYGVMLGDGCLSRVKGQYAVSIAGHVEDDIGLFNTIQPILARMRDAQVKILTRESHGKIEIIFSDKRFFQLFKERGFPIGKKGTSLCIPGSFDMKYFDSIIKGYFATDGCLVLTNNNGILYPRVEFSSISKRILEQVLNYLNSKGMKGNIYVSHRYKNHWNTLYRIQFNGRKNLEKFREIIGFLNPKHEEKMKKYKMRVG